jgi:hypothetical protein
MMRALSSLQFMGAPGQFPSVSMLDWTTGRGNARYWMLHALLQSVHSGDLLYRTTISASSHSVSSHPDVEASADVAAQVYWDGTAATATLLVVNKRNAVASVTVADACGDALVVDEESGAGPARDVPLAEHVLTMLPYATAFIPVTPR